MIKKNLSLFYLVTASLLVLLSSCGAPPKSVTVGGSQLSVSQSAQPLFSGTIYLTKGHTIISINGLQHIQSLTSGIDAENPAVSPDGKTLAFNVKYQNYSDIDTMPLTNGTPHTVLSGNGKYYYDGPFIKSNYYWLMQPVWSADGSSLLFLSDLQKERWYSLGGIFGNAPFLDLQVFSDSLASPSLKTAEAVAYASFGAGGDASISVRPGHPDEILYNHYAYDSTGINLNIQMFMADTTLIAAHPYTYTPTFDTGVAISPSTSANIQPSFSSDGNHIAYVQRTGDGKMSLYVMQTPDGVTAIPNNATTTQQALQPYQQSSLLTTSQYIANPFWSPDDSQIGYIAYNNQEFDLYIANISVDPKTGAYSIKGSPIQITQGGIDGDSRPDWVK